MYLLRSPILKILLVGPGSGTGGIEPTTFHWQFTALTTKLQRAKVIVLD